MFFKKSYIPSTISLWNRLDNSVKSITSSSAFNMKISPIPPVLPMYMNAGNRYLSVLLARIRHKCSGLNSDLFRVGIRPSPICHCGNGNEDAYHYFLICPHFVNERIDFLNSLVDIGIQPIPHVNILLWGDTNLPSQTNVNIILTVLSYIKSSKRFENF